jgi:hypothetical protein
LRFFLGYQPKLLSPKPRDSTPCPLFKNLTQPTCELHENPITYRMSLLIVDPLELIQIENH